MGAVDEDRPDAHTTPPGRKLAVSEAADELGISAEAVRSRVKWGTLQSVKEGATVYVVLPPDQSPPERDRVTDQTSDRAQYEPEALISEMRGRIEDLREQLEAERRAHAEARRIIAGLVERIPAIEAPQETAEATETADEQQGRGQPQSAAVESQEGVRRSWWRRIIGG